VSSRLDLETIVELIGNTTTTTGLKIKTKVDGKTYVKGRKHHPKVKRQKLDPLASLTLLHFFDPIFHFESILKKCLSLY